MGTKEGADKKASGEQMREKGAEKGAFVRGGLITYASTPTPTPAHAQLGQTLDSTLVPQPRLSLSPPPSE